MSFLIPDNTKAKQAYVKKAEEKQEWKLIGSMVYRRGLTFFEYNTMTDKLIKADIQKKVSVDMQGNPKKHMKVEYKKDCWYFFSLNKKNARRKINNLLKQIKDVQN